MALCLTVLTSLPAKAEEKACRRNADGSVTCSEAGLKTLTDAVLDARAKAVALESRLDAVQRDDVESRRLLDVCRAELRAIPPPVDSTWRRIGYAMGVAGGAMVAAVPVVESTDRRLAFGSFGLAVLGIGFGLVTW